MLSQRTELRHPFPFANVVVIAGGTVVDGLGHPPAPLDVTISNGRIIALTPWSDAHHDRHVIDAKGMVVTPGFIDVHSHADNAPFLSEDDQTKLLQGVTTEVVGNCGMSLAPRTATAAGPGWTPPLFPALDWRGSSFAEFVRRADHHGYVTNYAPLVGHSTVRAAVMAFRSGPPSADELRRMASAVSQAMEGGAFGLSSGLIYPPGCYADAEEMVALCRILPRGAVYATHVRNESHLLVESVREALDTAEHAGVQLQLSHHKVMGRANWGATAQTLPLIDAARDRGLVVNQDVYPYTAASTTMTALLPPAFHEGGPEKMLLRLSDAGQLKRLRQAVERGRDWDNKVLASGWDAVRIASTPSHRFEGLRIPEVAASLGADPFDAMVHILLTERLAVTMTVEAMDEGDVRRVMADPHTMIGSDGLPPGLGGRPHPRVSGTFPRVLARYAGDGGLLRLEEAVRKMTALPAQVFGIPDRGVLQRGAFADLVVFDAASVSDRATYDEPMRPPAGIGLVMLDGAVVVQKGRYLGRRLGRRLRPAH